MQHAPPAEAQRRAVGHFGDRLDRLGPGEEAERPRRRASFALIRPPPDQVRGSPAAFCRNSQVTARREKGSLAARPRLAERRRRRRFRLLGQMRFDEFPPRHRARPEPCAQAVDEIGEGARPLGLVRAFELDLGRRERLGRKTGEAHEVDAEARVDRVFLRAREPFGEEARDGARFVERPPCADPDAAHVAVDAIELELHPPSRPWPAARAARRERRRACAGSPRSPRSSRRAKRSAARRRNSGAAKRGAIEPRSSPLSSSSRVIGVAPNRAVIGARGRSAMSPMRLKPARAMSATVLSSRPSAASGRSWKSLAKALSLRASGAIFSAENLRQRPGGARIGRDAGSRP